MFRKAITLVLILILALIPGAASASGAEEGVMTWEEFQACDYSEPVTVDTYLQSWWIWSGSYVLFFAQGPDGGYYINKALPMDEVKDFMVPGTAVRISGTKVQDSGSYYPCIQDPVLSLRDAEPWVAEAEDVTGLLGTDGLDRCQFCRVVFRGMTVEPSLIRGNPEPQAFLYGDDGSGAHESNSDLYFNASLGGKTFRFRVHTGMNGNDTEVYRAVEGLRIGDTVDLEGIMNRRFSKTEPWITSVTPGTPADPDSAGRPEPPPEAASQLGELAGTWKGTCRGTDNHEKMDLTVSIQPDGRASMVFSSNGQVLTFPCRFPESGSRVQVSIPSNYIGLTEVRTTFGLKDGTLGLGITMRYAGGGSRSYSAECIRQ